MVCPKCGRENCQVVTETEGRTKGYGVGKGCLGTLLMGPFGLVCGLCGMGKGKTSSTTYWICSDCGNKFKS